MKLTLEGAGLPKTLDLSAIGLKSPVPVTARLDDGAFDGGGGLLTASLLFGGAFEPGSPGAKAPGFLVLGRPMSTTLRPASLGASISVDAVNQLLFAAWGSGDLVFDAPPPVALVLTPMLPPMLSVADGAVRVAIGEVLVTKPGASQPLAAVSIVQDVLPSAEGATLLLTPRGEPTLSITWLADGVAGNGRGVIADAAKAQITKLLAPFRMPLPAVALEQLGPSFAGQSLGLLTLAIQVDTKSARLGAAGTMALVPR